MKLGSYARFFQLALISAVVSVCVAQPPVAGSVAFDREEILEGAAFGISENEQLPPVDVLAVNNDMRAFLDEHVPENASRQRKVELILHAILRDGLNLNYHSFKTLTAEEAFYQREGNYLSFTNLFIALGREVGLDVEFQEVDVPASWDRRGDNHSFKGHINARVRLPFKGEQAVDFAMFEFDLEYTRRRISDDYAKALYHNNTAIYWLDQKQLSEAYLNLREAIRLYPKAPYFWTNLGTLHQRAGDFLRAEAAWLEAVRIADEPSAISNLARLYEQQGKQELAKQYANAAESYCRKNPYYLYELDEEAYQEGNYQEAAFLLKRTTRLREDEHEFHRLLGPSYLHLGDIAAAISSFDRAEQSAESEPDREHYNRKQRLLTLVVH